MQTTFKTPLAILGPLGGQFGFYRREREGEGQTYEWTDSQADTQRQRDRKRERQIETKSKRDRERQKIRETERTALKGQCHSIRCLPVLWRS